MECMVPDLDTAAFARVLARRSCLRRSRGSSMASKSGSGSRRPFFPESPAAAPKPELLLPLLPYVGEDAGVGVLFRQSRTLLSAPNPAQQTLARSPTFIARALLAKRLGGGSVVSFPGRTPLHELLLYTSHVSVRAPDPRLACCSFQHVLALGCTEFHSCCDLLLPCLACVSPRVH
jgi:hypothetical protein